MADLTATPEEFANLIEHFGDPNNPEPLHPDLESHLEEVGGVFGTCLRHPLVYSMMHMPQMNKIVNATYQSKLDAIAKLKAEGKWEGVVWLHERPYRLEAFAEIAEHLTNKRYWKLLGGIWTDSENIWQSYQLWQLALESGRPLRWALMSLSERQMLRKLRRRKTPILVYRGYAHEDGHEGMSWTLSYKRATWFAQRFAGLEHREDPCVATAIVDHEDIIAYFDGRGEDEIVVLPECVHITKIEELTTHERS